jgi:recombinational DNA repair protein (RecF pathway)
MRHKYATPAIVLGRTALAEASATVVLLTPEVGLIRARAQGVRKPGAKMASALQTFVESDVLLLRAKDGWRLAGALYTNDWFAGLKGRPARLRAGRIASLLQRLVHTNTIAFASTDAVDTSTALYTIFMQFLETLTQLSLLSARDAEEETFAEAAEILAALRILHVLGVDAGEIPGELTGGFDTEILQKIIDGRSDFLSRVNRGIAASGL